MYEKDFIPTPSQKWENKKIKDKYPALPII